MWSSIDGSHEATCCVLNKTVGYIYSGFLRLSTFSPIYLEKKNMHCIFIQNRKDVQEIA